MKDAAGYEGQVWQWASALAASLGVEGQVEWGWFGIGAGLGGAVVGLLAFLLTRRKRRHELREKEESERQMIRRVWEVVRELEDERQAALNNSRNDSEAEQPAQTTGTSSSSAGRYLAVPASSTYAKNIPQVSVTGTGSKTAVGGTLSYQRTQDRSSSGQSTSTAGTSSPNLAAVPRTRDRTHSPAHRGGSAILPSPKAVPGDALSPSKRPALRRAVTAADVRDLSKWQGEDEQTLRARQSVERQDSQQKLYGMDVEIAERINGKTDPLIEPMMKWIYELNGLDPAEATRASFPDALKSGKLLCGVLNKLRPGIVPDIHQRPIPLMERENIQKYLEACARLGVKQADLFAVSDLYEEKFLSAVVQNVFAVGRVAQYVRGFTGSKLDITCFTPEPITRKDLLGETTENENST